MPLRVSIAQGSLTDGDALVLVNASNTNAQLGTGVSAAIRAACGPGYQKHLGEELQRQKGGPMAPGDVLVTDAGTHPSAKWVAHVAVMDYRTADFGAAVPTLDRIRMACERLWDAVETVPGEGPLSVAMVALGAGTGGLGVREPTRIAAETLKAHVAIFKATRLAQVTFYGYQLNEFLAMAEVLAKHWPEVLDGLSPEARAHVVAQGKR